MTVKASWWLFCVVHLAVFCSCNLQIVHFCSRIARKSCGLVFLGFSGSFTACLFLPAGAWPWLLQSEIRKSMAVPWLSSWIKRKLHHALLPEELLRTLFLATSFSSSFLLADSPASFHDQSCCTRGKCCLVSCIELEVGAWLIWSGAAGSTSSLFMAPSPSKHPCELSCIFVLCAKQEVIL